MRSRVAAWPREELLKLPLVPIHGAGIDDSAAVQVVMLERVIAIKNIGGIVIQPPPQILRLPNIL